MKKMPLLLVAAFVLALGLAAPAPAFAKVNVVSTLQDFSSIASSIGGDRVDAFALAKGYQDPHFVDAKPSFIVRLSRADLLIVAGLELEIGYLPPLIDQSRNERIHHGQRGISRRLRRLRDPPAPDGTGHARHGRRPSVRKPPLLDSTPRTDASSRARSPRSCRSSIPRARPPTRRGSPNSRRG